MDDSRARNRPSPAASAAQPTAQSQAAQFPGAQTRRHTAQHGVFCTIVPPHVLDKLSRADDPALHEPARRTLERDALQRTRRRITTVRGVRTTAVAGQKPSDRPKRTIYDAANREELPGEKVRDEGDEAGQDASVNRAYAGLGATFDLYLKVYGRRSIDDNGLPLDATVHYGQEYGNAFWDGERMVFGDGDGEVFRDFTLPLDVIGHELTHGVTQYTANLEYFGQSGALNESVSDVFGVLIKQYALGQTAEQADWLIGAELLTDRVTGEALRSMKAPGTAYDDDVLGKDPQPATMDDYVETSSDNGGVHINSGIPNHAFYLAATALGGQAWERAGQLWYDVLTGGELTTDADFADFARLSVAAAVARYGAGEEQQALLKAWTRVGVEPA
ncbi:M4 family metallopeptidase [Streptomyces zagrosensis]|uniref:Neutral metalloproteinase n=1 Tax=Streptomyces zagrosensis TaxID=1042984 RepID=A0A7W9UVT5_9ACTN|nr:M4 family metallopeptidase [Streptomyces zagrosensis]MBB5933048.1 Zn-dependent metalloprotease [Streptomyces zagrosensis]